MVRHRVPKSPVLLLPVQAAFVFIDDKLMDSAGLPETYPFNAAKIPGNAGYARESLSETISLWLTILELSDNKEKFAEQVAVLKKHFLLLNGTLSWRLEILGDETVHATPYSATIDDLRAIRALLGAAGKWKIPDYETLALQLARAMKAHAVSNGHLLHQSILGTDLQRGAIMDLSYIDLEAMYLLAQKDVEWKHIYEISLVVLRGGRLPNGLFYDKFDVNAQRYYNVESNLINSLLCAIHLAERSEDAGPLPGFLKTEWTKNAKICGRYDQQSGKPVVAYESVAVYALAMRLALLTNELGFAKQMRTRILELASGPKQSLWEGSLTPDGGHSFDHLNALLSFVLYEQKVGGSRS